MNKRNHYSPEFKSRIVIEVLREEATVNEIASREGISPVLVSRWKAEFLENAATLFKKSGPTDAEKELEAERERVANLERKVGQLTYEVDWLKKNLSKSSVASDRKAFINPENKRLTVKRQAELLKVNRTSIYRKPAPKLWSENDLWLMRRIDELHTDEPTWGYRMLTRVLRRETGWMINRKKVRRLMRIMGIYTIFPKPNLSKGFHAQYIRPYLLRNVPIVEPDQVWGVDITYIRMQKGFMYLFVIIDWYSRMIIDYELSSTLEKSFVLACLTRALSKRRPQMINSDQGGHFTNPEYIALLEKANVKISMDGKGQCLDNAKTERFFRTLKYDRIYVDEYNTPRELRSKMKSYIGKYNHYRPHSSNGGRMDRQHFVGQFL